MGTKEVQYLGESAYLLNGSKKLFKPFVIPMEHLPQKGEMPLVPTVLDHSQVREHDGNLLVTTLVVMMMIVMAEW